MLLDYACSWLVVPPSSPALGSWGKDPDCHKGLGGVFCVSGPRGLSTEGSWVSWSTSWRIFGCNWPSQSFLVGLPPVVLLCQVTLQPSFLVFSSPSCPRVGSCFPTPFTFLHLAPPHSLPFFVPSHQFLSFHFVPFYLMVTSHFSLRRSIH